MKREVSIVDMMRLIGPAKPTFVKAESPPPGYHQATGSTCDSARHRHQTVVPARQRDNRRRSGFYQAEDLMCTPNKNNGNNEGQEPAAWGVLPPLTSVKDDKCRTDLMNGRKFNGGSCCYRIEKKLRQEMMKSAVKELAPCSGDGEEWLSWKGDTITLFTLSGRRIVLEENFSAEAQIGVVSAADCRRQSIRVDNAQVFCSWCESSPCLPKHLVSMEPVHGGSSVASMKCWETSSFTPKATEDPEDMINRSL
jgi:hypothetical protein